LIRRLTDPNANYSGCIAIEEAAREGVLIVCADGLTRICFPIIAGFAADYEEQVLITGIKSGQHCAICQVAPKERHRLCQQPSPLRTHQSMQAQIEKQRQIRRKNVTSYDRTADGKIDKSMWVHERHNFAWRHHLVNIHEILHIDILHQLLKGIIARSMDWIKDHLSEQIGSGAYGKNKVTVQTSGWELQLDDRFRQVPPFPGLRVFPNFSNISQWTGVEQKALLQQLVPVVAPLLIKDTGDTKDDGKIEFIRAIVDFVTQAVYKSHDDTTLRYMNDALRRIDLLKWSFAKQQGDTAFNYPKFHVLSHWTENIRKFGAADGFDTAHFEAAHIYLLKNHYELTNKRVGFEEQILSLNTRRVKMLAMIELQRLRIAQPLNPKEKVIIATTTTAARSIELERLDWHASASEAHSLGFMQLRTGTWRRARTVDKHLQICDFIDALAVFIREERLHADGIRSSNAEMERLEQDPSWVNHFPVCIHSSINCWKPGPPTLADLEPLVKEAVRCSPAWLGEVGVWRRDCVWVQEFDPSHPTSDRVGASSLEGRLPGELQVVITVLDTGRLDARGKPSRYVGALVDVFRLMNKGRHHERHGMIEVQRVVRDTAAQHRTLGHRRFYRLDLIDRSVHLVPVGRDRSEVYYINPYIDWGQYNSVYDRDFDGKDCQAASKIHKKRKWRTFDEQIQ
jgi:Plavaka transposase